MNEPINRIMTDRIEDGVQFRAVKQPPFNLQSHWVAEQGKPVMVIPPRYESDDWLVYAPLSGHLPNGVYEFRGTEKEERAFVVAAGLARQG